MKIILRDTDLLLRMKGNELQNRDFNIVSRMVEKVLRDKMLDNIEIIVRNKDIND